MEFSSATLVELYIAVFMFILFLASREKKIRASKSGWSFSSMVLHLMVLLCTDSISWTMRKNPNLAWTIFYLLFQYTLTMLFILEYASYLCRFIDEYFGIKTWGGRKWRFSIVAVSEVFWLISFFSGWFFVIQHDGSYTINKWFFLSQIGALLIVLPPYLEIIRNVKTVGKKNCILWLSFMLVPAMARPVDILFHFPMLFPAMSMAALLIYTQINLQMAREIKEKELELKDSYQKIMVSQIQPHFLYNVLNTICYLIKKDPKAAAETTNEFSSYLRMNLTSLEQKEPILFEEELRHVETYLKLEKRRFGDALEVLYEIEAMDFHVPILTLQPIVENAVKHGVCQKEDGGYVLIKTWEDLNSYCILVKDNGVGFDTNEKKKDDGRTHIGVSNTRERIVEQCGGKLEIKSTIGEGTEVTIYLPKKTNAVFT